MKERRTNILVVDDDPTMREVLRLRLEKWGFQVVPAAHAGEIESLCDRHHPHIVISDVVMPGMSGLELLRLLKSRDRKRPVVLITAHGTVGMAVEAMKQGALDFLTKPLDYSKLKAILDAAQGEIQWQRQTRRLDRALQRGSGFGSFVGNSKPMREVYRLIGAVAGTDASVMITGESGTGKELVARSVHEHGPRSEGPFIAINTAAIPADLMESEILGHQKGAFTGATDSRQGCFELAHGGTLLLDEIAEMPPPLQVKLLRVLEDGRVRRVGAKNEIRVDARVLAATNQDPQQAVSEGRLREDLFFRLNVFTIHLPPLRQRRTDIPLLTHHFVRRFNDRHGLQVEGVRPECLERLAEYEWPGNVRELRNVVERAVVLAREKWVELAHLPPYLREPQSRLGKIVLPAGISAEEAERVLILKTLEQTGNNKAETARRLGLDVKTIRNKLKSYGLM